MDAAARKAQMDKPFSTAQFEPPNVVAHETVYRALRLRILNGEISPGTTMTLRGVAKTFDVSTTPVREALRRLAAEGALTVSHSGRIFTPVLSNDRIEELAALRALIETELASRALPRAHGGLIERMHIINQRISEATARKDPVAYIRSNLEFHRSFYLRAQAPAMLAMAETVWLQLGPTMRALYDRLNRQQAPKDHNLILAALRAGDEPTLRLAVRSDVTQGLRMLMG